MEKIVLILGFIICEVMILGDGSAAASGIGFSIFSVAAFYFAAKHTK